MDLTSHDYKILYRMRTESSVAHHAIENGRAVWVLGLELATNQIDRLINAGLVKIVLFGSRKFAVANEHAQKLVETLK